MQELVNEVRGLLPGRATIEQAEAWLDQHCSQWRSGPAPRGRIVEIEVTDDND